MGTDKRMDMSGMGDYNGVMGKNPVSRHQFHKDSVIERPYFDKVRSLFSAMSSGLRLDDSPFYDFLSPGPSPLSPPGQSMGSVGDGWPPHANSPPPHGNTVTWPPARPSESKWSPGGGSVSNSSLAHELWKVPLSPKPLPVAAPSRPPPGLTSQKPSPASSGWDGSALRLGGWTSTECVLGNTTILAEFASEEEISRFFAQGQSLASPSSGWQAIGSSQSRMDQSHPFPSRASEQNQWKSGDLHRSSLWGGPNYSSSLWGNPGGSEPGRLSSPSPISSFLPVDHLTGAGDSM
ncbi:hypothetical protein GOODEAATRI_014340 [Goodea atripinnis]|uniref:TNRC6 PABC binding domain-containing protein n=1 Tax=Goodea atripinnis TaxID=208336 RepID=A0ABV0MTX5_9TELE